MQVARDALELTFAYVEAFETEAEHLIDTTITDARFDALVTDLFGSTGPDDSPRTQAADHRRRDTLTWLWKDADTLAGIRGTAWAGYQAITEYLDRYAPVRAKADHEAARAIRLLTSDEPAKVKRRAWSALAPA